MLHILIISILCKCFFIYSKILVQDIISILDVLLTETTLVTKVNPDSVRIWDRYRRGPIFVRILDWSNLGPPHPVTRLGSNCILLLLFSWHHCRQGWVDQYFLFHCLFLPLTFLLLRSLSALSDSFYLKKFYVTSPIAISVFSSPPFPHHYLGICSLCQFFVSHLFSSAHQFLLRAFLHSNLHSHFINILSSALLTLTIILTRLFFRKPGPFPVVSLLVPSSLVHVCRGNTWAEHISFTYTRYASISHHPFDFPPSVCPSCKPHCNQRN